MGCHGNGNSYSCGCVAFRIVGLPSFNGFSCKLTEIALLIYFMQYLVECMTSSVISFAYFTNYSNLNIS